MAIAENPAKLPPACGVFPAGRAAQILADLSAHRAGGDQPGDDARRRGGRRVGKAPMKDCHIKMVKSVAPRVAVVRGQRGQVARRVGGGAVSVLEMHPVELIDHAHHWSRSRPDSIARLLGVSVGTLYNHIPDLRELRADRTSAAQDGSRR
ncbi:hypothetical protein [Streptosporangium roseum]|uniref:hypothetical protein n=1 Tax=Streptosporangium roseum TaxID=2001 RepID=UPI00332C6D36